MISDLEQEKITAYTRYLLSLTGMSELYTFDLAIKKKRFDYSAKITVNYHYYCFVIHIPANWDDLTAEHKGKVLCHEMSHLTQAGFYYLDDHVVPQIAKKGLAPIYHSGFKRELELQAERIGIMLFNLVKPWEEVTDEVTLEETE